MFLFFITATLALHHLDLQSVRLKGNATDLHYFYAKVHVGTQAHPQYLIVDTGSSVVALPCMEVCESCGKHLNGLYEIFKSKKHRFAKCNTMKNCLCDRSSNFALNRFVSEKERQKIRNKCKFS